MALPIVDFPVPTFQQANPGLTGAAAVNNLLGNVLQNQILATQAKYAPEITEAKLKEQQMRAKYPLLYQPGVAGQIGSYLYMQDQQQGGGAGMPQTGNQAATHDLLNQQTVTGQGAPAAGTTQQPQTLGNVVMGGKSPSDHLSDAIDQHVNQTFPNASTDWKDVLKNSIFSKLNNQMAQTNYLHARAQSYNYATMPVQERSAVLAQAAGAGYTYDEANRLFMQGKSLRDLLEDKGFTIDSSPLPIWPTTPTAQTQIQTRRMAIAELNSVSKEINNALAPYSRRIFGYSPSQVIDAISGKNDDEQARVLAAKALQPELSSIRFRASAGSRMGIEAIRELTTAMMGNIKTYQGLVSSKVYSKAQNYIDNWINQMVESANKVGLRGTAPMTQSTLGQTVGQPQQQLITMISPTGKRYQVSAANRTAALKAKWKEA